MCLLSSWRPNVNPPGLVWPLTLLFIECFCTYVCSSSWYCNPLPVNVNGCEGSFGIFFLFSLYVFVLICPLFCLFIVIMSPKRWSSSVSYVKSSNIANFSEPSWHCLWIWIHFLTLFSVLYFYLQSSQGGGHRTLLYGHAILLRHYHSSMVRDAWVFFTVYQCFIWCSCY